MLLQEALGDIVAGRRFTPELAYYRKLYGPVMLTDHPWLAVYLTDRCHPNITGHRLIAEALVSMVETTGTFRSPRSPSE